MKNFKKFLPALAIATPLLAVAAFGSANGGFFAAYANAGYGGQPDGESYKQSFAATLSASQEVPPTTSIGSGSALFNLTTDEREIDYTVNLSNETGVTGANLYCAQPGSNGPEVVSLFNSTTPVSDSSFSGTIVQSDLLSAATACNPNITDVPQLAQAMREGSIYVNILTSTNPSGDIRGQLGGTQTTTSPTNPTGPATSTPPTNPTQPSTNATVTPENSTVTPQQHIDFNGRDFNHEEDVTVTENGSSIETVHADGGGNFSTGSLTAPATPGTYTYTFTGNTYGDTASATVTVSDPNASDTSTSSSTPPTTTSN
jgi:hypothetical protein